MELLFLEKCFLVEKNEKKFFGFFLQTKKISNFNVKKEISDLNR